MFGKKKTMPEEMRMHFSAPSFYLRRGNVVSPWTREEAKGLRSELSDAIVVVHPGINMLSHPKEWARILSDSYFVLICGDEEDSSIRGLKKALEREIYSPVTKHLSGVAVASSLAEGQSMVLSMESESEKRVVTLNNTEEEMN